MGFRSARLAADKGLNEVAELLGVSRQAVWNWERGYAYPEASKLMTLARFLGCPVEDLLTGNPTKDDVQ